MNSSEISIAKIFDIYIFSKKIFREDSNETGAN